MNHGLLKTLFFMAAGYLSGSLLFGRILPKYFKNMDIEEISADHNPGTANVMKYAGIPLGVLCLVLDIGKGYLPILWAEKVVEPVNHLFAGIGARPGACLSFLEERPWRKGDRRELWSASWGTPLQQERLAFGGPLSVFLSGACGESQ